MLFPLPPLPPFSLRDGIPTQILCLLSPGCQALGHPEEPASHELRQAEPLTAILL